MDEVGAHLAGRLGQGPETCRQLVEPGLVHLCGLEQLRLLGAEDGQVAIVLSQGEPSEIETQCGHFGLETVISLDGPGLAPQRSHLPGDLTKKILKTDHVLVGPLQTPLTAFLPAAMLQNPRRLLDHGAVFLGRSIENLADLVLANDHMLMCANTGVGEEVLNVE